jgi:starch phosphorylase
MVRHTLQSLGPKVLASRMVRDYTEQYYLPAAASLRRTVAEADGLPFGHARELSAFVQRVREAWPEVAITDVDSTGLPDTPLLGSELTLTALVALAGLRPDEVVVQAVLGRVDSADVLQSPVYVDMAAVGPGEGGTEIFSVTMPLPLSGSVGYTVRVLPHHALLAGDTELGLVKLA